MPGYYSIDFPKMTGVLKKVVDYVLIIKAVRKRKFPNPIPEW